MTMDIVTTLLVNTIVFSILFGLVLVFRKLLSGRISAVMQYALLAIVVLKLVIPFGFESAISPLGWIDHHSALPENVQSEEWQPDPYAYNNTEQTLETNDSITPSVQTPLTNNADVQLSQAATFQTPPVAVQTAALHWSVWATIVWLAGAAAMALWLALSLQRMRRRIRHTQTPVPKRILAAFDACKKELGIKRPVRLVMQTAMPVPAITGIIRPMLIVPGSITNLGSLALRSVFLHELTHCKYGDLIGIRVMNGLSCLYWFNPLVWLCFKLIRNDMETICDQRCLRLMDRDTQSGYVNMLLHFAGSPSTKRLQAAIAITDGRTSIEKRIRNMFKRRRTSGAVKILVMLVALVMLFTCVLTACQPTPEAPVVVNKNEGVMESAIAASPEPTDKKYEAPETWVLEPFEVNAKLTASIDAQVEIPDTNAYPVYEFVNGKYTQEQVDKIIEYFYGDTTLYNARQPMTKSQLEEMLVQWKLDYQECLVGATNEAGNLKYDSSPEDMLAGIEALEEQIKNAPETNEVQISDGQLVMAQLTGVELLYVAPDLSERNLRYLQIKNAAEGMFDTSMMLIYGNKYYPTEADTINKQAEGISRTPEETKQIVQDMLNSFGFDFMEAVMVEAGQVVDSGEVVRDDLMGGYRVTCIRRAGDFLVTTMSEGIDYIRERTDMTDEEMKEMYAYAWPAEKLYVYVDDTGVTAIEWQGYGEVGAAVSENVKLLPFERLPELFENAISAQYSWMNEEEENREITVDRVVLSMARVQVKDNPENWQLVPVWEFYGTYTYYHQDGTEETVDNYGRSLLIINAIDGSMVI